jgi:mono/diheme cytochrome c family protein
MKGHTFSLRWLAVGLAITGLACGDSGTDESPKPAPTAPAKPAEPAPAPTEPAPPVEPAEPAGGAPPATADAAAGAITYQTFCAACHGAKGDGDSPFAQTLNPPPTAHSDGKYMNTLTDDYLFRLIKEGGMAVGKSPNMAPWGGSLSDAQIRDVMADIRTLAVPPYQAPTP